MTPEEREVRRERLQTRAREEIAAREKAEDDSIIALFDGAPRATQQVVVMLLQTKRAAELTLRNSNISLSLLKMQQGYELDKDQES